METVGPKSKLLYKKGMLNTNANALFRVENYTNEIDEDTYGNIIQEKADDIDNASIQIQLNSENCEISGDRVMIPSKYD